MTFAEFKKDYKLREEAKGPNLEQSGDNITQKAKATDAEIRALYDQQQQNEATGLYAHGPLMREDSPVLTLKSTGK